MLYVAHAGVFWEGSGVIGIFNSLSDAKLFVEEDVKQNANTLSTETYYKITDWDMEFQKATGMCYYDWKKKEWEEFKKFILTA
jgi:hypothetical protein